MRYPGFIQNIRQLKINGFCVDLPSLFSEQFLAEYTSFTDYNELLSHLRAASVHDLASVPAVQADSVIREYTEFNTYEEMLNTACDYFIVHNTR